MKQMNLFKNKKVYLSLFVSLSLMIGESVQARTYKLVTSTSEIEARANYLFVADYNGAYYAIGTQAASNRTGVAVQVLDNAFIATAVGEVGKPYEIEITGSADNWVFKDVANNTYLKPRANATNGSGQNGLQGGNSQETDWSLSMASDGRCTITANNTAFANRHLYYNNNTGNIPLFACYSSAQTASNYKLIYLYKEVLSGNPLVIEADKEVTLSQTDYDNRGYTDIIFKSNNVSTGQLKIIGESLTVNNGTVKLEKTITKHGAGAGNYEGKRKWYAIGFPFDIAFIRCSLEGAEGVNLDAGDDFWLSAIKSDGKFEAIVDEIYSGTTLSANQGYAMQFPDVLENEVVTFTSVAGVTLSNVTDIIIPVTDEYKMIVNPSVTKIDLSCLVEKQHLYVFDGYVSFLHDHGKVKTLKPFESLVVYEENIKTPKKSIVNIEGGATGLTGVDVNNDDVDDVRYYNLQGIEISKPTAAGIYIVKTIYKSNKVETTKQFF